MSFVIVSQPDPLIDNDHLFISHNLAVIRQVSTQVAVMYLGRIVELADRDQLFDDPLHPYTHSGSINSHRRLPG